MKRIQSLGLRITVLVLFLATVTLLVVIWRARSLPHPAQANQNQLLYWLLTRDLAQEKPEIRRALLERLLVEARRNPAGYEQLDGLGLLDVYRDQLSANARRLQYDWFLWQCERYEAASTETARHLVLSDCVETVVLWQDWQRALRDSAQPAVGLTTTIERLRDSLSDDRLGEVGDRLIEDAVVCWLGTADLSRIELSAREDLAESISRRLETQPLTTDLDPSFWTEDELVRLRSNGELLMEAWTCRQSRLFQRLELPQRQPFVQELVANVERWGVLSWLVPNSSSGWNQLGQLWQLNQLFARWIERAEGETRESLKRLTASVQRELIRGQLQQTWQSRWR